MIKLSGEKDNSFLVQGMILALAGIITRLIGIAYRIPVNNILGDEGQGLYGCAFSVYNIALLLTSYSLPLAVSKLVSQRVSQGEHTNAFRILKGALLFAVIAGGSAALLIFFFSDFIAAHVMSLKLSTYALKVLAPGLLTVAIMGVLRGYFQGMGTMVPTALSQIIEQIANAIVSITCASYFLQIGKKAAEKNGVASLPFAYGAAGGTMGTVIGAVAGLLFLISVFAMYYPRAKKRVVKRPFCQPESYNVIFKTLIFTIAPVILSTAIYNISDTVDQGIFGAAMRYLGHEEKKTAKLLGMFTGKYNTLINIPLAVANALGASLMPSIVSSVSSGNKEEIRQKTGMVIRFTMLLAIPSCAAFLVMPNRILSLLYVGNIDIPATMLRLGAVTVIFYCLSTVTNSILQGLNRMTAPVWHGAVSLLIHLACVIMMLFVFHLGIYALVIGNIIFSLSMCILNSITMRKESGYRQEVKKTFLLPCAAAAVMGVSIIVSIAIFDLFLPGLVSTVLSIIIAVAVYGCLLLKMGLMRKF